MKTVQKANKILTISDEMLGGYLKDGFDEIDSSGKIIGESPTKTYTAADVLTLKKDYDAQLAENAKTIAKLMAEIEKLKKKLAGKGDDVAEAPQPPAGI